MSARRRARPAGPRFQVLEPPRGIGGSGLGEVWQSRELLLFLALRDLKVRYTQAVLGWLWAVLQPLLLMAVFAFFFGHLARVPSDGLPYAVFVLCGTAPWSIFANSVSINSESLTRNSALVSKVYFPRVVVPIASVLSYVPDLAAVTVVLVGFALLDGIVPGGPLLLLPAFLAGGAEVMVLPALVEGFGLPALEALACGVPVVCGRYTGALDVLAAGAVVVDVTRPPELAAGIDALLDDDEHRRRLAAAGRREAEALTAERMASATLAVYRDVLAHRSIAAAR